jgi:BCD family chlorophyll transporter-like MFS transporter
MLLKQIQLGLIHAAVAITLVPINSTLNRILIEDIGILAIVVTLLFSPPYLFSLIQVGIGSFSDKFPVWGFRRTPYIAAGLVFCVTGLILATQVVYLILENLWLGIGLGILTFGAWGMGFNLATVSYFSLASELSGEEGRSKTTSIMFFIMILFIIGTAAGISNYLETYTPERLQNAFTMVAFIALIMGILGLFKLETRHSKSTIAERRHSLREIYNEISANSQVKRFFIYLVLMLAAVLGQDVLLEPFAARAFGIPVDKTTFITSIWGTAYLVSLLLTGFIGGRVSKIKVARLASWLAILAFGIIAMSGFVGGLYLFYTGLVVLGIATGPATVSNLSIMLDMTVPGKIGMFIGAWGSASAFARLLGSITTAIVRDVVDAMPFSAGTIGYASGFLLLAVFLLISLEILKKIDVNAFIQNVFIDDSSTKSIIEHAALSGDV